MGAIKRTATITRGAVDLETGEFPMTLATEGEASDGHILSIRGLEMPERMPMLFRHDSTPTIPVLGSISTFAKGRKGGVPVLRGVGRFNLNGDDPLAEIRRGFAQVTADGDLNAVSIRWDTLESTRRVDLAAGHKYRVDPNDESEARWGHYITASRGREGSLVGVGADPAALIGRADAASSESVRDFWRCLGGEELEGGILPLARSISMLEQALEGEAREDDTGEALTFDELTERVVIASERGLLSVDAREDLCSTLCAPRACSCQAGRSEEREGPAETREDAAETQSAVPAETREVGAEMRSQPPSGAVASMTWREFEQGLGSALRQPMAEFAAAITGRRGIR